MAHCGHHRTANGKYQWQLVPNLSEESASSIFRVCFLHELLQKKFKVAPALY
jgi:hypothetical protein